MTPIEEYLLYHNGSTRGKLRKDKPELFQALMATRDIRHVPFNPVKHRITIPKRAGSPINNTIWTKPTPKSVPIIDGPVAYDEGYATKKFFLEYKTHLNIYQLEEFEPVLHDEMKAKNLLHLVAGYPGPKKPVDRRIVKDMDSILECKSEIYYIFASIAIRGMAEFGFLQFQYEYVFNHLRSKGESIHYMMQKQYGDIEAFYELNHKNQKESQVFVKEPFLAYLLKDNNKCI